MTFVDNSVLRTMSEIYVVVKLLVLQSHLNMTCLNLKIIKKPTEVFFYLKIN